MRTKILALAAFVAGCGPLVQIGGNAEPPPSLLTLSANAEAPAAETGEPVLFAVPGVPGKLRTMRVPVTTADGQIQYLARANWIEQPNRLFQRVLADTFESVTGRPAIDESNVDVNPALRVSGTLLEFGLDVRGGREAIVRYDAVATKAGGGLAGSRRFEARLPVSAETGPAVAAALDEAANLIAREVAAWAGGLG